jgi:hypothetical protein
MKKTTIEWRNTPMRFLLTAAAIIALVPVASAADVKYQVRDTADLVAVCDTDTRAPDIATALAFCHGFLTGSVHFYYAGIPESSRFVCAPDPVPSRSETMNGFVEWTKANPQYMSEPAVETLFRYLAETYPCP